jgi:uncharacterized protein (DUF1778 family)
MPRSLDKKPNPLSMRMPESDLALIDRAAGLRGRSRTDFVRDAAVRAAEDVIMETALIRMSASGFDAFLDALVAPPQVVPEMAAMLERQAPWEDGQG